MPFPISHKFLLLYYVFAIKMVQMEDITNGDHKYNRLFMTTTIRHSSKTETWWVKVIYPYPHPPPQRWNEGEGAPSPPFHLCGGGCGCTYAKLNSTGWRYARGALVTSFWVGWLSGQSEWQGGKRRVVSRSFLYPWKTTGNERLPWGESTWNLSQISFCFSFLLNKH